MTKTNPPQSGKPRVLTGRRIVLLASVAAIGAAVLVVGPFYPGFGGNWTSAFAAPPANAAVSAPLPQQPLPHPQASPISWPR